MRLAAAAVALGIVVGVVGCKGNKNAAPEPSPGVTDISPAPTPPPQPAPVVVQPAPAEPAAPATAGPRPTGSITGAKYTVQKGDTLYNIAVRKYGRGSQANIDKIQRANPGLRPETLQAGQTINLP